jgi:histidinol-phosphate aminotransferase
MTPRTLPYVRPELALPSPYRWQEGIPEGPVSRFDMNTLPLSPAWWPEVAAEVAALPAASYPEATYRPLRESIGAFAGFAPEQVVPGAGADELILLTAQLALGRGDLAVVARPTYQLYAVATRTAGATLEAVDPLDGSTLRLDLETVLERAPDARLVWLCSPNNPTGEEVPAATVEAICGACPGLVLLDQAYLELGGEDLSHLIERCENLVVARTFSKGWGLGAIRCGYALASPAVAGALDALRPPGSLSLQSARAAELACARADAMRADAIAYRAERDRLAAGIRELGLEEIGGAGNFVTFRTPWPSDDAFAALAARGLVVRTFGHEALLAGVLRACIASPPENDRLVEGLAALLGRPAPSLAPVAADPVWGRRGTASRRTRETTIDAVVGLDGAGRSLVSTGVGFVDHMLTALATHGLLDLELSCMGDMEVDAHHTVEDCGIVLGQALDRALGDRRGIHRFGDARAPLDEALAECTIDLGGRGVSEIELALSGLPVGGVAASLWPHMLDSLARAARINLHLTSKGEDDHHVIEAAFKALARALRAACERDPRRAGTVPSTKGVL